MKNLKDAAKLACLVFVFLFLCVRDSSSQNHAPIDAVSVVNITIPAYPLLPLGGREEGIVSAAISVNSSGKVEHVVTSGASESLRRAAEDAARRWEFKPHGRSATINFVFVLKDKKADVCKSSVNFLTSIRVEICEERKKIVTISDPPMVDLTKSKKQ